MSKRFVRGVILCEDRGQANLARKYLVRAGLAKDRNLRVRNNKRGSGEQWVREQYPLEIRELRRERHQRQLILITMIDANSGTVDERLRSLARGLRDSGQERPTADEPVFLLIPKRNVETWIWFLVGNSVNENDDYKRRVEQVHRNDAVDALCRLRQSAWPQSETCPASLVQGFRELRRIEERLDGS